jgi:hypothetical protein
LGWHVTGAMAGKSTHRGVGCGGGKDGSTSRVFSHGTPARRAARRESGGRRASYGAGERSVGHAGAGDMVWEVADELTSLKHPDQQTLLMVNSPLCNKTLSQPMIRYVH